MRTVCSKNEEENVKRTPVRYVPSVCSFAPSCAENLKFGDLQALADVLTVNTTLTSLILGSTEAVLITVCSIAGCSLTVVSHLLSSVDVNLGPAGAGIIAQILRTNSSLASLDLGCKLIVSR
jgi:hypothetical protein